MIEYDVSTRLMGTYNPGDYVKFELRDERSGQSE
jgi:hypothetical protein